MIFRVLNRSPICLPRCVIWRILIIKRVGRFIKALNSNRRYEQHSTGPETGSQDQFPFPFQCFHCTTRLCQESRKSGSPFSISARFSFPLDGERPREPFLTQPCTLSKPGKDQHGRSDCVHAIRRLVEMGPGWKRDRGASLHGGKIELSAEQAPHEPIVLLLLVA